MNIWIVNHYAVTPDLPGGTRHYDLARFFARQGHEVTVFASSFNHWSRTEILSGKERFRKETYDGVNFVWIRSAAYQRNDWRRALNMLSFAWRVFGVSRSVAPKPDVVLGSSPHLPAAFSAWKMSRRFKTPFVLEIRDLWPQSLVQLGSSRLSPAVGILAVLEKFLYARSVLVVNMIGNLGAYFASKGIVPPPVLDVPNSINAQRFRSVPESSCPAVKALREFHRLGKFVFGYAGAMGPANGLEPLIQAAASLSPAETERIQLVFIGEGPSRKEFEAKAVSLQNVSFLPAVPRSEVPAVLREIDVPVFIVHPALEPSLGSPNKLLDYMAAGKPVLCAAKVPAPFVEQSGGGISVAGKDPPALAAAMRQLASYPRQRLQEMGEKGRKFVSDHYNLDFLAGKLLSALKDLIA